MKNFIAINMKCLIILILFTNILFGQERVRDTLFFKYDKDYIIENEFDKSTLVLNESETKYGSLLFSLLKGNTLLNLKPKKILELKKYVRNSKFYNSKDGIIDLIDKNDNYKVESLWIYMGSNYVIFLIDGNKFIEVYPGGEIIE
ncbi:MAG: hypothetical protein HRT66_06405 [Flavobacteriaceae bacterium]|nr:hypothetical protein [Flavobacteriaceae bacterium]